MAAGFNDCSLPSPSSAPKFWRIRAGRAPSPHGRRETSGQRPSTLPYRPFKAHFAFLLQPLPIGIFFSRLTASALFGIFTVSTPFSKLAATFSTSTDSGTRNERWKLP